MSNPTCKCGAIMESQHEYIYYCIFCGRFWVWDNLHTEWRFLVDEKRGYHEA